MKKIINKFVITLGLLLLASLSFAEPVWIDVRTVEENLQDNIPGDVNMPMAIISPESLSEIYGKNAEINFYCRSGNRAGKVEKMLTEAGFTNVHNLGGIDEVRKLREEALQSAAH